MEHDRTRRVAEMHHGTKDEFLYLDCPECEALTLLDPPLNWERYYPDEYYSLAGPGVSSEPSSGRVVKTTIALQTPTKIAELLSRMSVVRRRVPHWYGWARRLAIARSSALLDVGCGSGRLLHELANDGFTNLTGVDPYVSASEVTKAGVRLMKGELADVEGSAKFYAVMFHHSLEHVPAPASALRTARDLLNPGGSILIRVPVADSWAYRHYQENWFQIDAPRHHHLFTKRSMMILAAQAGLRVEQRFFDSTSHQFSISEAYKLGVPLREATSMDMFTTEQESAWKRRAVALNKSEDGDQAGFILRPVVRADDSS